MEGFFSKGGLRHSKEVTLSECTIINNRLYFRGRLYIPDHDELRTLLLQRAHDSPAAGHQGNTKLQLYYGRC